MININRQEIETNQLNAVVLAMQVIAGILNGTHKENEFPEGRAAVQRSWAMTYNDRDGIVFGIKTKRDLEIESAYRLKLEAQIARLTAPVTDKELEAAHSCFTGVFDTRTAFARVIAGRMG